MRAAAGQTLRISVARLLLLTVVAAHLVAGQMAPLGAVVGVAGACVVANLLLWAACRLGSVRYDPWAPLLDVVATAVLMWLGGGYSSCLAPVFILPALLAAWSMTPPLTGAVVLLAGIALAAVDVPATVPEALRFLVVFSLVATAGGLSLALRASALRSHPNLAALSELPTASRRGSSLLSTLAQALARFLRAETHAVLVPREGAGEEDLRLVHAPLGLANVEADALEALGRSELVAAAVRSRRAVVSAQARSDDRLPKSATETLAIRSVLAMPVYLTEGLEGVILLVARGRDAFHEGDIAVAHLAIGAVRGGLVRPESETVAAIVRDMPEAAALIDAAGTMETASPAGHELFDTDPDLWNLALAAADTARETGARAVAEGASGAEGWQADAFPLGGSGGRALVRVRAGDGDTGGALREFPIAVGQAIEAPLRAVRDYARALGHSAEADPATRERLASNLVDQTGRLGRAVNELLAAHLARLSSDDLVLTEVDLAQVAREGVERARSASPSATISLQADEYVPAVLDEGVMGRAIDALIDSALALENVLVLHAAGDEQAGLIAVDLGRALPTRLRRRLFEPFAISREGGGLGLGFFIARYVALAHGGDMRVAEDGRSVELLLPRHGPG